MLGPHARSAINLFFGIKETVLLLFIYYYLHDNGNNLASILLIIEILPAIQESIFSLILAASAFFMVT